MASAETKRDIIVGLTEKVVTLVPEHAPTKALLDKLLDMTAQEVSDSVASLMPYQHKISAGDLDWFCSSECPEEVQALRLAEIRDQIPEDVQNQVFEGLRQTLMVHMALGMMPPQFRETVEKATTQLTNSVGENGQLDQAALMQAMGSLMGSLMGGGGQNLMGDLMGALNGEAPALEEKKPEVEAPAGSQQQRVQDVRKKLQGKHRKKYS